MTTINDLAQIDAAADDDKIALYSAANSATRGITIAHLRTAVANLDTAALTQLAQPDGADLVGYGSSTVGDTLNAQQSSIAAKVSTSALAASGGSALVGFQQAGTGAVARTVQDRLRDVVSVKDFGAKGDAATDDTAAIQAAINTGCPVFIPPGTYIIHGLDLVTSTGTTLYQQGARLIGAGEGLVKLINRNGGAAIRHRPTSAQAAASCKFFGGELSGFTVTIDGSSPAGAKGIELYSFWFPNIHDIQVSGVNGNGIETPADSTLSANPDYYSCGTLTVDRVTISGCTGKGIFSNLWSNIWRIRDNYITNNAGGGIDIAGAGHMIEGGAVAGNGTSSGGFGIHFNYAGGAGTPHNCVVRGVELDNNWGTHVWAEGYSHSIEQNRYIQDAAQGTGGNTFRNTTCVLLDAVASGSAANNVVREGLVRLDNAGAATITAFKVVDAAGAENNAIVDITYASTPSGLTKYSLPAARKRNYAVENGVQVAGSSQHVYGRGQVVFASAASSLLLTTTPQVLPFNEIYDDSNAFASNAFTVPYAGVLDIRLNGVFRAVTTANVAATLYVYKNGSVYHTQLIPQGFSIVGSDCGYSFHLTMLVAKGDVIDIRGSVATSSTLYWISSSTATTKFQML